MADILRMRRDSGTVTEQIAKVAEHHPIATAGIIVVFEPDGSMHTYSNCDGQQKAVAAARLIFLAGRD